VLELLERLKSGKHLVLALPLAILQGAQLKIDTTVWHFFEFGAFQMITGTGIGSDLRRRARERKMTASSQRRRSM